ncbi:DeoR/GlpR family DNA-binding transcription regulator [Gluconobacter kanchanaburiensis]|uniref:DeoR family transcriptional regulator n=1 Tax=Gluconobacter kanchanaburiensis NBRC 103587 TaxID=1307948 RepID=A0A511B7N8_9PROT|nr:DeoR/GlpR family DNA-binding transcription regulator [Gluconobacter kanchanaburiensis]MBF0862460.1 DeoR/GlpR transcriptional regulator [Gluconobacter kanchanaburiensis]GBR68599.1 transcriptional regulator [Gluconobacter kanchanaburiensis NBRC 103587]GEK96418.1 DeoR family transcriptional regulator [Gluconobacter kanchanaburiensis NBRC 103587]
MDTPIGDWPSVFGQSLSGRCRGILDFVMERGAVPVEELVKTFSLSQASVNRDLMALSVQGLIRRTGKKITALPGLGVAASVTYRSRQAVARKTAIAALATSLISPGETLAFDDSTTARCVGTSLTDIAPLAIVTNSLGLGLHLGQSETITFVGLGGHYLPAFDAFVGMICEQAIHSMRIDTAFVSAAAIDGLTAFHQSEDVTRVKRALMETADRRVLLVDSGKFGRTAMCRFATLAEFDVVITDDGLDPQLADLLRDAGVPLWLAPVAPATDHTGAIVGREHPHGS